MSITKFSHTCPKALRKMWKIIMDNTIRILINRTNNHTKTMVIKNHINKTKRAINKMDSTIKIKKAINNMKVKRTNKLKVKKDTMISMINQELKELLLI